METRKWIFLCIGFLVCLYGLITMQILMTCFFIIVMVLLLYSMETVIPAIRVFLHNVQRIADNLEEIKARVTPGSAGFEK
jgi:hypothetical protein